MSNEFWLHLIPKPEDRERGSFHMSQFDYCVVDFFVLFTQYGILVRQRVEYA